MLANIPLPKEKICQHCDKAYTVEYCPTCKPINRPDDLLVRRSDSFSTKWSTRPLKGNYFVPYTYHGQIREAIHKSLRDGDDYIDIEAKYIADENECSLFNLPFKKLNKSIDNYAYGETFVKHIGWRIYLK
jgi:hypothetical protein